MTDQPSQVPGQEAGALRGPFAAPHPASRLLDARTGAASCPPPSAALLEERHRALYALVPSFECEAGCTACCGAIAMTAWEWSGITDQRRAAPDCLACPYAAGGCCAIHPARPLVCRLFGAVDDPRLTCPKGRGPARKLSTARARTLMQAHHQLMLDSAATLDAGNRFDGHEFTGDPGPGIAAIGE